MKTEVENAEKRKVWLKCGGYIAIDKTEALTAIDVNSGKFTVIFFNFVPLCHKIDTICHQKIL